MWAVSSIDPNLSAIYRHLTMARWWRVFIDKLSGKRSDPSVVGPRRRQSERYTYAATLKARCSSWPKFVDLISGDVSAGGLFVPTTENAQVGERVELEITLPNSETFPLGGTVVNIISEEQAARFGKKGGLGIQLDPLEGDNKIRFDLILNAAREAVPQPEQTIETGSPRPQRPQTEGPLPTSPSVPLDDVGGLPARNANPVVSFTESGPGTAAAPKQRAPSPTPPRAAPPPIPHKHSAGTPVVGIDLGTTYTSVATVVGSKVSILKWPHGGQSSPSVVSFPTEEGHVIGAEARKRLAVDPAHTVNSPKRLLGRQYDDREIQGFIGQAPYRTLKGPDGSVLVEIWQRQYAINQLCSYLLGAARDVAEDFLGQEVRYCVMTIPVSFDETRAQVLRRAASLAGLEVAAFIDEPSAAALANRFDPNFGGYVGVYDFGGGTFDFTVVDVSKGDFQVMATAGDTWLGGDDFDSVIAEAAANQFWREHKVDLRRQAVEWQKLVFACERAKRMLSVDEEAVIFVPDVLRGASGMIDLNISINRATFERASRPVIDRSLATCDQALELLGMQPSDLTTVYLSGGTTYMPVVREALARHFAVPIRTGVPPEHSVCLGAAIHAAQVQMSSRTTLDQR